MIVNGKHVIFIIVVYVVVELDFFFSIIHPRNGVLFEVIYNLQLSKTFSIPFFLKNLFFRRYCHRCREYPTLEPQDASVSFETNQNDGRQQAEESVLQHIDNQDNRASPSNTICCKCQLNTVKPDENWRFFGDRCKRCKRFLHFDCVHAKNKYCDECY